MRTITFYSYKGGVGRSLALANIATRLSEFKKQVCLLDFDLEAPGLHYKFAAPLANHTKKIRKGVVDYIQQFTAAGIVEDSLREYSYSWFPNPESCMTIIPAGNPDAGEYWKKLSSINWYQLLYENENGLALLLDLKEKIRKEINPDFLLVDSRTGISELSGIALSLFADDVVVLAANNRENLDGARKIMRSISDPQKMLLGRAPEITFVLCRVPFTSSKEDRLKEENLKSKVRREFNGMIKDFAVIHSDRDLEENEQIKIGYDKDESVAQISRDYLELFELLTINDLQPTERENFKKIKKSEKAYQEAMTKNDVDERLKLLERASELNPRSTEIYLSQAAVFEKKANWQAVVDICDKILHYETLNIRPYECMAHALLKLRRLEEAKVNYRSILSRDPQRMTAKLGLAQIATLEMDFETSLAMLDEILTADPFFTQAYVERAEVKRLSAGTPEDLEDALSDVYKALDIQFDSPSAMLMKAKINATLLNKDEFYNNFELALQWREKLDLDIWEEICVDMVFIPFLNEPRFRKILKRFNIQPDFLKTITTTKK